jgi:hypothetical protein
LFLRVPEPGDIVVSDKTNVQPPVEVIPSVAGEISAVASAHAPFLYFDNAPVFGCFNGVVRIMLEAVRTMPTPGQTVSTDRVIVAHLRMSIPAALALKAAIEGALLLATPAAGASGDAPKPN